MRSGGAQEMPAVVEMRRHARVLIGMIGMLVDADVLDDGIDLDRVEPLDAEAQRVRHVVARTGADDQHVLERRAAAVLSAAGG